MTFTHGSDPGEMLWFRCNEIIPGVSLAILFIAIALGGFIFLQEAQPFLDVEPLCRMAESQADKREAFRAAGKTAFVLGYTGETGTRLVKILAKEKLFKTVTLIGRREIDLSEFEAGPEFVQKMVDFDDLDNYSDMFKGHDVAFCALGTTRHASGADGFVRVDHDYTIKAAELAKAGGTKHFQYMSTYGANPTSSQLYTRTKGQVEEALKVMHFERLSIFRPAVLMVDRKESRPMEAVARFVLTPISKIFPTAITIPIEAQAQAMVNHVVSMSDKPVETFENKEIHVMSGTSGHCKDTDKTK